MDIIQPPPPPPLISIPQVYNNNDVVSQHHSSSSTSSPTSSLIIVIIIISSAIIVTATIYLLIRFISRRFNRITVEDDVVSDNRNENEHVVISLPNNDVQPVSLPLFTFSSLTGKIAGGDCAVCLSKFESVDQLRLLPLCCHAFHAECIDTWLKSNQTCPLCRSSVNPSDDDVMNKIAAVNGSSFRIHIGSISRRRDPSESRRSYSIGSYDYILDDDGYEISVESTHRRGASDCTSVDKDSTVTEPPRGDNEVADGGSGRRNWLRDYVDRVSVSLSSRTQSFRGSGRFFTGSSRRNETVEDFDTSPGRIGEEISELFRWFSGV